MVGGRSKTPRKWRGPNTYTDNIPDVVYGCDRSLNNLCTPNPNGFLVRRDDTNSFPENARALDAGSFDSRLTGGESRRFRGFSGRGTSVTFLDKVPDYVSDAPRTLHGQAYPEFQEAGDLLPTFVTPNDAKKYIDEVDSGYRRLDTGITSATNITQDFKTSWGIQLAAWTAFAIAAKASVGWLNTKAVMDQTDRFNDQLKNWFAEYGKAGGTGVGPMPTQPGQGVPGTTQVSDVTKLVIAGSVLAAILVIAPKLLK